MAAKANNKMNISYTIKAIDRFTKTHDKLERQFSKLEDMTKGLTQVKEIKIDVDNAVANAKLEHTEQKVKDIPKFPTIRLMVKGFSKGLDQADQFATRLRTMEELSQGFGRGALFTALPALAPVLGIAAGGAGALASSLFAAGAGAGAFAAVAVPTIGYLAEMDKEVKRGSQAWYKLSDGTRSALGELDKLRSSWSKLQDRFREPVLGIFAINLQSAQKLLKEFTPVIESSVDAVSNLSKAFDKNLMSDDVQAVFEWLGNTAGPYLEDLVKTVGNFGVGFMSMMKAFDPLAQDFADGFLRMSEKFREWASTLENNKAFQDFMAYVSENGPTLLSLIGNITKFLVNFGIAIAPLGTKVLELTNAFFAWASELIKNHEWIAKLIGVGWVAQGMFAMLGSILAPVIVIFRTLWPVLATVFKWFGSLKGVLTRVMPWIVRIGTTVLRLGGPLGWLISTIIFMAGVIYSNWDSIKKWTIETFTKVKNVIKDAWAKVEVYWGVVKRLAAILAVKFGEMVNSVRKKMGEIKDKIEDKWDAAQDFLEGINLFSIGGDIIRGLVDGISSIDVWGAVTNVGSSIKSAFTSFFKVHSPSRLMRDDVGKWITLGVVDGMTSMASKAEREANMVANAIAKPFQTMEKDYTFSAVGSARSQYAASTRTESTQAAVATAGAGGDLVIEVPVTLDGRQVARGTYRYVTEEQRREASRVQRFKG
ncbi:phage tail protein [Rossellomorea sp. LjRoot5]|uniref:phage tail protein n=1 Tax=Rossellomorea sp. LjRoot5 TaxID=3342331 RepID=UPI003ECEA678